MSADESRGEAMDQANEPADSEDVMGHDPQGDVGGVFPQTGGSGDGEVMGQPDEDDEDDEEEEPMDADAKESGEI